jgi:hypothetical protein
VDLLMKRRKIDFDTVTDVEAQPARIISDPGFAAIRDRDGAVVPMVQIDATNRHDILSLFAAHGRGIVGEASCQWGRRRHGAPDRTVTLFLHFNAPARLLVFMDFDVVRQGFLVEEILRANELYIQAIRTPGATEAASDPPRIRVTVPETGFRSIWNKLIDEEMTREMQTRGLSAIEAKAKAEAIVQSWRNRPN